jgi:L,D-transpeptidase YcbB
MRSSRTITGQLALLCAVSAMALPAFAADGPEILARHHPQPALSLESPINSAAETVMPRGESAGPVVAVPDLPAVAISVPAQGNSGGTPLAEPTVPDLPAASVTFTEADTIRASLANRLADTLGDLTVRLPRKEQMALATFYQEQHYRPIFVKDAAWTPAARFVMQRLKAADEDGLDATDYPVPVIASKATAPDDWAEADVKLSAAAIAYARDARGARLDPSRLSSLVTPKLDLPDASEVLSRLETAPDAGEALLAYNPSHPGYRALRAKLAELRASRPGRPMVSVPQGRALRVGMRDPRVALIRARFNLGPADDQNAYDERVASAVASFQKEKGLPASGVLTAQTIAALGAPIPARLEGDLIANMERWRWLPSELGARYITVNVPEYRLRIVDNGGVTHETRVIVGKSETPTPIFSDEMETVIVNPSWTVPPSIMKKEILPAMAIDPDYAARRGYRVLRRGNGIVVQQPPGERNALGFIKFIFPNQYSVYLHDTPSRSLFAASRRAFSHGCVRVEQPFRLAEEVLEHQGQWSEAKLKGLIGKGERYINLRQRIPVHITYFTVMVDERGKAQTFDDLYGLNRKVRAALGLAG